MTSPETVAGLAPELKGAKKGQGESPIASASERFTSYDVEAFEVPGGREENWRFTPLRRLRGLHDGSASLDATTKVEVSAGDVAFRVVAGGVAVGAVMLCEVIRPRPPSAARSAGSAPARTPSAARARWARRTRARSWP